MKPLPPLKRVGGWDVDELVPGWIVASAGHRFGQPSLKQGDVGSQVGIDAWGVGAFLRGDPDGLKKLAQYHDVDEIEIIVLAAFLAGMEWQKDRKRRQRMVAAVHEGWERSNQRRKKRLANGNGQEDTAARDMQA